MESPPLCHVAEQTASLIGYNYVSALPCWIFATVLQFNLRFVLGEWAGTDDVPKQPLIQLRQIQAIFSGLAEVVIMCNN